MQTGSMRTRLTLVVAALGAVALTACTAGSSTPAGPSSGSGTAPVTSPAGSPSAATPTPTPSPSRPKPTPTPSGPRKGSGTPVQVRLFEGDGQTYGVAMPIIAYFSSAVTDPSVFDKVVTVTVNGVPVHGAWYWEPSSQSGDAMEAHYRLPAYWPAHASIKVDMPLTGLWAGSGLVFSDSLTLSMSTGAAQIATVDGRPGIDSMTITSDGKPVRTLKVSLGEADTPTYLGTAVVMEKDNPQHMVSAPGEPYYSLEVPWSVRVTYDGEFIHDAYWNDQLGQVNLSHGCTNLSPADAQWYYTWSQIGDPVTWTNTGTDQVIPVDDGWGDWNLPWSTYSQGGELKNS